MSLISQTIESYHAHCNTGASPRIFRAPGRVNLIGDHTDYNDGFVLPVAIDRQIVVAATIRQDSQINVYAHNFNQWDRFDFQKEIHRLSENNWGNYVRGVAWALLQENLSIKGMDAVVAGDIPIGAGLSSSAAMEVAIAFALLSLSEAEMDGKSLALTAQKAENDFVGMRCGIMDQLISCLGLDDHALLIDCRHLTYQRVPLLSDAVILIIDSGVHRGLMDMEYNARRGECENAATYLGISALRDLDAETFKTRAHELPSAVQGRVRHVISENERTLSAAEALTVGDLRMAGNLMAASHASLRDDFEVSCPELDVLVKLAMGVDGVYGARLTGAGFGGCMVALVAQPAVDDLVKTIEAEYPRTTGRQAAAYICRASQGVSEIERDSWSCMR